MNAGLGPRVPKNLLVATSRAARATTDEPLPRCWVVASSVACAPFTSPTAAGRSRSQAMTAMSLGIGASRSNQVVSTPAAILTSTHSAIARDRSAISSLASRLIGAGGQASARGAGDRLPSPPPMMDWVTSPSTSGSRQTFTTNLTGRRAHVQLEAGRLDQVARDAAQLRLLSGAW